MANTRYSIVGHPDERGSALIGVLLLLMMMSALVAALGVSGRTETFISRNQYSGAQAQAAAEAGLNHAVELVTTYIFTHKARNQETPGEAIQELLFGPDGANDGFGGPLDADNGSLEFRTGIAEGEAIPIGICIEIVGGARGACDARPAGAKYAAVVMDDDDPRRGTLPDLAAIVENGDPFQDLNERLIIRATGYGPDNTRVVLEAVISPIVLPAVATNGDLNISESVWIEGARGSVHANGNLTIDGIGTPRVEVAVKATASGDRNAPDYILGIGPAAQISIPETRASEYRSFADYILTSDGRMMNALDGSQICAAGDGGGPCEPWGFDGTSGWSIGSAPPEAYRTYYVEGAVTISGSFGSAEEPIAISIIAEKSINIPGSPHITAATASGLLFATDADLEISGGLVTVDVDPNERVDAGRMLVHEQIHLSGSPVLAGHILVDNADSVEGFSDNRISGNVRIRYDGSRGYDVYHVSGWRDVR